MPLASTPDKRSADPAGKLSCVTDLEAEPITARAQHGERGLPKVHPVPGTIPRGQRGAAVEAAVRAALHEDRLLLAFQPVVCAETGQVDYFECLLRMRSEQGNIIAAAEFITPLEELGVIGLIDRFVLQKTVELLAADPEVRLGFNVSGLTVSDRAWLRSLTSLLRRRPDLGPRLVVEITETAALGDIAESAHFVDTLRQAGCRVALDDFGAGYTSLRHLQALPVQIIKIDGSLIRQMTSKSHTRVFLRHLLGLARNCRLITVAESVEQPEEAALLRLEGISRLQGYLIGRPTVERSWRTMKQTSTCCLARPAPDGTPPCAAHSLPPVRGS